jgi:glycosyltransferase involved in cell wall biosynthesis
MIDSYKVVSSKVVKVGHGYELQNAKCRMQNSDKYILYLGTLEPRKNVETLILAYKKIYDLGFKIYDLIIVGDRGWKSKSLIHLINSTPGVKYIGYVDEAKKSELYQNASLFVFPSLYEGFGLPVLEAMAHGVPVIASNRPSLPEVAGEAGYYINPCNIDELAQAMKRVLTNEELRQNMIQKGVDRARTFSWTKSAEEFVQILTSEF